MEFEEDITFKMGLSIRFVAGKNHAELISSNCCLSIKCWSNFFSLFADINSKRVDDKICSNLGSKTKKLYR